MENFTQLIDLGKSLGLQGAEVIDFANNKVQEIEERERRCQEREEKRFADEREEKRFADEREEKRLADEREEKRLEKEERRLTEERDREFELRKLELELERERIKSVQTTSNPPTPNVKFSVSRPKLPYFNDKVDNIESYLYKFELHATSSGWPRESWAGMLVTLLQGRALDYFREMPLQQANDFDKIKQLLLKRFVYTEEAFKEKFRAAKPEKGEDFSAFVVRLSTYFNRWIELADVASSFDLLKDLMVRDQIYSSCHKDLVAFLKERKPKSVDELTTLSEQYREAHPMKPIARATVQDYSATGVYSQQQQRHHYQFRDQSRDRYYSPKGEHGMDKKNRDRYDRVYRQPNSKERGPNTTDNKLICYRCQKPGHIARNCRNNFTANAVYQLPQPCDTQDCVECKKLYQAGTELNLRCGHTLPVLAAQHASGTLDIHQGFVNRRKVSVLRDSGCTTVGISRFLVGPQDFIGKSVSCVLFTGGAVTLQVARILVDTPFVTGELEACVLDDPVADLIIGNIPQVKSLSQEEIEEWYKAKGMESANTVQTRSSSRNTGATRPLKTPSLPLNITRDDLIQLQTEDKTLHRCFQDARCKSKLRTHKKATSRFYLKDDLLYREYRGKSILDQLVVPSQLVPTVMKIAHDSAMSGHMGIARTRERVLANFYWPKVFQDVKTYCKSCDLCQRTAPKNRNPKAPLQQVPTISCPFEKVSVDLIGPIYPVTDRGHRYILTLIDNSTRWPEAVPLRNITAETVAEALFGIFSRLGIPNEILTDQGSQFMSEVMRELFRLLGIKPSRTSPYHPQANGMVERLNGTLKMILKRVAADRPKDWDRYLPAILFSYREVRQETTGFSPFELLFGRKPRGPIDILHDVLTNTRTNSEEISTLEYITNLRERLESSCEIARMASNSSLENARQHKNKNSRLREFKPGDKALLLLPTDNNKLLMTWKGPFDIIRRTSKVNYIINMDGKEKLFHVNMLKEYYVRPHHLCNVAETTTNPFVFASVGLIDAEDFDPDDQHRLSSNAKCNTDICMPQLDRTQTYEDVYISDELSKDNKGRIKDLLYSFQDVLSDIPGKTGLVKHIITLTSSTPIRLKPYPIPFKSKSIVEQEVTSMLQQGIIEPSTSCYSSPIVLVRKKDGSIRFAIDFRKLNAITVFDSTPIPNQEELIVSVSSSSIFSKLDLTKGYWQIPMNESSREYTAFQTPLGLFQWKFMPFGLVNAPATFARMMRILLKDIPNVISFFDDILIHTSSFDSHLEILSLVFTELRKFGLTAKPSKISIACPSITFLGHIISHGKIQPEDDKIGKVLSLTVPKSKKEVRSLIGILSYYRKFIPNFASLSAPLSDLTKKGRPDKIQWNKDCQLAFTRLQTALTSKPVLILPDIDSNFILRTDASDHGLGACLLQEREGTLHPVMYASRKLLPRESRYAIIEKECLAIVWAIDKLSRYLHGGSFIVQSDHKPLKFLKENRTTSARLARWALSLQMFSFEVQPIPGSHNFTADVLSRLI